MEQSLLFLCICIGCFYMVLDDLWGNKMLSNAIEHIIVGK